jgi:hypothetical protein
MDGKGEASALNRPYTELVYQPMLEAMQYLRANGYKTYIVTGDGQDFVRVFAGQLYGIPPEQIVGTAGEVKYGYAANGTPLLTKESRLLFMNDACGGIQTADADRPSPASRSS